MLFMNVIQIQININVSEGEPRWNESISGYWNFVTMKASQSDETNENKDNAQVKNDCIDHRNKELGRKQNSKMNVIMYAALKKNNKTPSEGGLYREKNSAIMNDPAYNTVRTKRKKSNANMEILVI